MDIKALSEFAPRLNWRAAFYIIVLLLIASSAFWVRALPSRFGELQAIDPFYLYRMSEHVYENNWQLPEVDLMRHHPFGATPIKSDPVLATSLLMHSTSFAVFENGKQEFTGVRHIVPTLLWRDGQTEKLITQPFCDRQPLRARQVSIAVDRLKMNRRHIVQCCLNAPFLQTSIDQVARGHADGKRAKDRFCLGAKRRENNVLCLRQLLSIPFCDAASFYAPAFQVR